MPWVRKMYREGKVWVEVDEDGQLVESNGLVKIRYRKDDDREYSARADQVEEIDQARLEAAAVSRSAGKKKRSAPARPEVDLPADAIVIYTDGACYRNPGPAGIGALLEWKGRSRELSEFIGEGTNNIAELTAILRALEEVKNRGLPVHLFTDSAYAIGVLVSGWKVRENQELVQRIQQLLTTFADLHFHKVKGHAGDPRNERVDQLARDAIDAQT